MSTSKRKRAFNDRAANPLNREFTFVNHSLSREEEEELDSLDCQTEFPLSRQYELVEQGFSVKFSIDYKNQTYRCALTDSDPESPTHNVCITGYGETPEESWHALAFRIFHIAGGDMFYFMNLPVRGKRR